MHLALGSLRACHSLTNEDCSPMTREDADNIMQVTAKSMLSSFYYLSSAIRLILWKEKSRHNRRNPIDGEFVKKKKFNNVTDNHKKGNIIWKCDILWLFMHKCLLECDQWLHKHPPPRKIWGPFLWNFLWVWHQVTKAKWRSFPHSGSTCFAVSSFRKTDETALNSVF